MPNSNYVTQVLVFCIVFCSSGYQLLFSDKQSSALANSQASEKSEKGKDIDFNAQFALIDKILLYKYSEFDILHKKENFSQSSTIYNKQEQSNNQNTQSKATELISS